MTTQQQQTDEPQELTERLARLEGAASDIPRQLDTQNRTIEGLRTEMHASIERLREETQASIERLREETQASIESLRAEIRALSARVDRLANAMLIGSIALSVSLVGGLVTIFVAVLTRT